jgi:hypothetical protein
MPYKPLGVFVATVFDSQRRAGTQICDRVGHMAVKKIDQRMPAAGKKDAVWRYCINAALTVSRRFG